MNFIYRNGQFLPFEDQKLYKGVFTTLLVLDGKALFLKAHLKRIQYHCALAHISFPNIDLQIFKKLIFLNRAQSGIFRMKIIIDERELTITLQREHSLIKEVSLCIYPDPCSFPSLKVKMSPYAHRTKLLKYAKKHMFDDCLIFDSNRHVLETSIANVFWIKEDVFFYPENSLSYFQGITLDQAIILAQEFNLNIQSGRFYLHDLQYSTLFYCNSIKGILPVKHLENVHLHINQSIIDQFFEMYQTISFSSAVDLIA